MGTKEQNDRKQHINCRHCGRVRTGNRPRRLCWTCYYTPSIRDLYPPDPGYRNESAPEGGRQDPPAPCPYPPGSEAKIQYLKEIATRGDNLFHPDERKYKRWFNDFDVETN